MRIDNQFEVPLAPAEAWPLLMNVSEIVPCFPGAELVETVDAASHKGRVTVKLGPMTMVFAGNLRIENRDDTQRSATVRATWTETKGRGNAVTVTRFVMREQDGGTVVEVESDVQLAGQIAQYGRGAGIISEISAQLTSKFADNLRAHIHAASPAPEDSPTGVSPSSPRTELSVIELLWRALLNSLKRIFS